MESINHESCQTKSSNLQFLHLVSKFLATVFFFSVILIFSSLLPSIFSSNFGKNYMFLLCNGILVLIVKNSGLMENSDQEIKPITKNGECSQKTLELPTSSEAADAKAVAMEKVPEKIEDQSGAMVKVDAVEKQANEIAIIDEDEEENFELLSAEELKKKCDDFIRKMKQVIKSQ